MKLALLFAFVAFALLGALVDVVRGRRPLLVTRLV
jgi:hypothetical protein